MQTIHPAHAADAVPGPGRSGARPRFRGLGRPAWRRWLLTAGWLVVAVVLQLLRSPRVPLWDVIWAEDGRFFYGEARAKPWPVTLFEPLAGYLQVVPRALSAVVAQLPVVDAARGISISAAFTAAVLSIYVFVAGGDVLPRRWQRAAVAALVVLHPATGYEVNAALNNLHWYLLFAAFWACVGAQTSRGRLVVDTAVVVLAALSDPLAGILLPLAVLRAIRRRPRAVVLGGLVVAMILQYVLAISSAAPRHGTRHLAELPLVYALRVAASFLLGDAASRRHWDADGTWFAALALAVVATGFAVALGVARGGQRRLLGTLLGYSVLFFLASLAVRGGAAGYLTHRAVLPGSRYMIVPLWMMYAALIVAAGLAPPPALASSRPARILGYALPTAAFLLIGSQLVANFAPFGARSTGTSWRAEVEDARLACHAGVVGRPVHHQLPAGVEPVLLDPATVAVPVAPYGRLFWAVRLRCDQL